MDLMTGKPALQEFYEAIAPVWEEWIQYKGVQHGEQYKSPTSEMYAIKAFMGVCDGNPYVAAQVNEYCQGKLWKGLEVYDQMLLQKWKAEAQTNLIAAQYPHLAELKSIGFPRSAWSHPRYFSEFAAEVKEDYSLYVAETRSFFGPTAQILTEDQWNAYRKQKQPFSAGFDSLFEVVSNRLQWHIDFNTSLPRQSLAEYFETKASSLRLQYQ